MKYRLLPCWRCIWCLFSLPEEREGWKCSSGFAGTTLVLGMKEHWARKRWLNQPCCTFSSGLVQDFGKSCISCAKAPSHGVPAWRRRCSVPQAECILLEANICPFLAAAVRTREGKIAAERWDLVWDFLALQSDGRTGVMGQV